MGSRVAAENLRTLSELAGGLGIDLISSLAIDDGTRGHFHEVIREISSSLGYAVVMGLRLSGPVLQTVQRAPTWTYYHHYRTVNFALDQAALRLAGECARMGYRALPVPASQVLDWDRLRGHLSHKEMGKRAGLGWRGRNNLLVNRDFGSHVRYVTVLTDLPLPERGITDDPGECGNCRECISVCPVGAIQDDPDHFDLDRCTAQLRRFSKSEKLNVLICGLCVRVCTGRAGGRHDRKVPDG